MTSGTIIDRVQQPAVSLVAIPHEQSDYGPSLSRLLAQRKTGSFIGADKHFLSIVVDGKKCGEIEYAYLSPQGRMFVKRSIAPLTPGRIVEIISMVLDTSCKGKGYGRQAFEQFSKIYNIIILMAAPQSKKFWMKMGFVPLSGKRNYQIYRKHNGTS